MPTPNLDRLAARGTVFERAYAGSTPCMPARRDVYTGRYEFPERGWGPLEEGDLDLPSLLSPPHTTPITSYGPDDVVSYFISDHKNMWCAGSGNYHFGFSGFEFIRGQQEDPWATTSDPFYCPPPDLPSKLERYWRNKHRFGDREQDMPVARTFSTAAEWLRRNAGHRGFYLQIDEFDPHEPWDPPEEILRQFDPRGYHTGDWSSHPPYARWGDHMDEDELLGFQARYAGKVVLADRWLGKVLDAMDELDLWRNTMVIVHTDHGTFNGDHGRIGKLQTHEFAAKNMIPFIVYHPQHGHGERRDQLVQNVDIYATVLAAFGRELPEGRHGVNLLPVLADPAAPTRDWAHRRPVLTLGHHHRRALDAAPGAGPPSSRCTGTATTSSASTAASRFSGAYADGRRLVQRDPVPEDYRGSWLSDLEADPCERTNVADRYPDRVAAMREALRETFDRIGAPAELRRRFRL